ncbi:MAG: ribosome biogenesis GTPase Der [Bacteroidetes bacterium]|nr:ribosome biogenesis GTPase Der [Bacteroidota bacterium]MCW5896122.1 ribosome biogenesis GTPase Der [Bacteroidota bacterium]
MSHWLVALVGRPNVGKSTLFNRIVGRRDAIVDDMPGVTRDRNYADAEWAGKRFSLVDTGGYVPASEDIFETAIREQAQIAIDEADVVLFVGDAQTGVLPTDAELANILRKTQKKVLLVVNKIDGEKKEAELAEFYRLGLGEPYSVSALGGRKIGDLLDVVTQDFDTNAEEKIDPRLKLAIIGKPNVGKSSFVNGLLQEDRHIVTDIPGTTRDPIDAILKYYGEEILLVDTAGLRRKSKIKESVEFYSTIRTLKSIERCDVAVVLIDATQGLEHQDLRIIETATQRNRAVVIAVNKWDLIEKDDKTARLFEKLLKEKLRIFDFIPIMFISALTKQRVYKVIELAKVVDAEQNKRIATSELNNTIGEDIKVFPPRSRSGKEIKIKYITQVKAKPPVFAFFCNEPKMIDDNYRRYLENKLRQHFAFTGVPLVLSFKQK